MKLATLATTYPLYVRKFYAANSGLAELSYMGQKAALNYDAYGWADFWSNALCPLGYDVLEISASNESLQRAWAREHGVQFNEQSWLHDLALEQVKDFRPDILFVQDYTTFSYEWLTELRQTVPSIQLVIGWCGAPYRDPTVFRAYDVVLSCIPELVDHFCSEGHRSVHMHHAFEPRILGRLQDAPEPAIPFTFVGQIVRANQFHRERERLLEQIVDLTEIRIFSGAADFSTVDRLKALCAPLMYGGVEALRRAKMSDGMLRRLPVLGRAASWPARPPARLVSPKLEKHIRPAVFGLSMFQALHDSCISFNSHIDISPRSASNMRLFEVTGVGSCLITDWKENLSDMFEAEVEVVTYRSAEECVERVRWLLDHPKEREQIAAQGQARTLKDHTFARRAELLDELLRTSI